MGSAFATPAVETNPEYVHPQVIERMKAWSTNVTNTLATIQSLAGKNSTDPPTSVPALESAVKNSGGAGQAEAIAAVFNNIMRSVTSNFSETKKVIPGQHPQILMTELWKYIKVTKILNANESPVRTSIDEAFKSLEGMASVVELLISSPENLAVMLPKATWTTGTTIPNAAVLKLQLPESQLSEGLLHEIVVGLVLNRIRSATNCFMYVYGGFYCSMPQVFQLVTIGNKANPNIVAPNTCKDNAAGSIHACMFGEFVAGRFLVDFLEDDAISQHEKDKTVLALVVALAIAWRECRFIHGDLHIENVMVETKESNNAISYGDWTLTFKYRPVVIDYGKSSVSFAGKILTPLGADKGDEDGDGYVGNALSLVYKGAPVQYFDIVRLFLSHHDLEDMLSKPLADFFKNQLNLKRIDQSGGYATDSSTNQTVFESKTLADLLEGLSKKRWFSSYVTA